MNIHPLAGQQVKTDQLLNVSELITAYFAHQPDPENSRQRAEFGTSGHRGCAFDGSFNEWHILAMTQAICLYRKYHHINGPLFLGFDTHALSIPATVTALEVLAGNEVVVMIAKEGEFTPTPAISHAILTYNKGRVAGLADGIVVTPSHNPPKFGGFKYNPSHGGPADEKATNWIQVKANYYLTEKLKGVNRLPYKDALRAPTTHRYDFIGTYVDDLSRVVDMDIIKNTKISLGVDPLGGAGVHYWPRIAETYKLNLTVVSEVVDPTFRFMTLDWDGQIRMDPSSPYAMKPLINLSEKFDVAFACDTDHDRHGIVTRSVGLLPPNHYLVVAIWYLFQNREWDRLMSIGTTAVSSEMINRIAKVLERDVYDVPVGFKWFVNGLLDSSLGFAGEESAGASFARLNGKVWTTDKDGITMALLAAEITATMQKDPGSLYQELTELYGSTWYQRIEVSSTLEQMKKLKKLTAENMRCSDLVGEKIITADSKAGNGANIGGVKISTKNGWFVVRPSGTENVYKIYAESYVDSNHLKLILDQAQSMVKETLNSIDQD